MHIRTLAFVTVVLAVHAFPTSAARDVVPVQLLSKKDNNIENIDNIEDFKNHVDIIRARKAVKGSQVRLDEEDESGETLEEVMNLIGKLIKNERIGQLQGITEATLQVIKYFMRLLKEIEKRLNH